MKEENVFYIDISDYLNSNDVKEGILYAPLGGNYGLITHEEYCLLKSQQDKYHKDVWKSLSKETEGLVDHFRTDTAELYQIDILANNKCNFSCTYCYSAAGRSSQVLDFAKVKTLVDFLFKSNHNPKQPYIIHFSGGGEPLLSLDLIIQTVAYLEEASSEGNRHPYKLGIVTNGSLVDEPTAQWLHSKNIEIVISFEILEHLQNKERGNYKLVSSNIQRLSALGIPFSIRTTFTSEGISYMSDMVEEVYNKFPGIRNLTFDVVLAPRLFPQDNDLRDYYRRFLDGFYKAKERGKELNIGVSCLAAEPLYSLRDRMCNGKFVLTPWGELSACSRVTSSIENHYNHYRFGYVSHNAVVIDEEHFAMIMDDSNIHSETGQSGYQLLDCRKCFARWNCGGGCSLFNKMFPPDTADGNVQGVHFHEARCEFVREALRRQLFSVIRHRIQKKYGVEIDKYIEIQHTASS